MDNNRRYNNIGEMGKGNKGVKKGNKWGNKSNKGVKGLNRKHIVSGAIIVSGRLTLYKEGP